MARPLRVVLPLLLLALAAAAGYWWWTIERGAPEARSRSTVTWISARPSSPSGSPGAWLLFMLSTVGIGLMISSLCTTQPQALTYLNPLRYCLIAVRGVFLKDLPADLLIAQFWPMALTGGITMAAAAVLFRRRLS